MKILWGHPGHSLTQDSSATWAVWLWTTSKYVHQVYMHVWVHAFALCKSVSAAVFMHPVAHPSDMKVVGSILGPCCFEQVAVILMNIFNPHRRCLTSICFPRQMEINVVKKRHRTRSKGVRGVCGFHASVAYMDILKEELLADCLLQF